LITGVRSGDASRLRRWALAVAVAVLLIAGMATAPRAAPQAVAPSPPDVEDGERLYFGACANCHGPEGDAIPGIDFSHGQIRRASSDADLAQIIQRGIPGTAMPPGNYSNTQATQIVAYLRSLVTSAEKTAVGDPKQGRIVFEGKGQCLTCHQVGSTGSRSGPDLTGIGRIRRASELERALLDPPREVRPQNRRVRVVTREGADVTGRLLHHDTSTLLMLDRDEQLRSFRKSELRDVEIIKTSPKSSYRGTLSAQEIADVIGYLVSLKGPQPIQP